MVLPCNSWPSMLDTAELAESTLSKSTKPNPLDRPLSLSVITLASVTLPKLTNASFSDWSSVPQARPPTKSFEEDMWRTELSKCITGAPFDRLLPEALCLIKHGDALIEDEEEEERSKAVGWSGLYPDLLAEIFSRLDVVDYLQCMSVCASWRSIPEKAMNFCKPKIDPKIPWLLVSARGNNPGSRRFYVDTGTKRAGLYMHLPQIAHRRCIGSSQGFLITVDSSPKLCALNPLTGARFPLPPATAHPDILVYDDRRTDAPPRLIIPDDYMNLTLRYRKAVISPSHDTIVVATEGIANVPGIYRHQYFCNLAFARAGDDSWTGLIPPCPWRHQHSAADFIFHKGYVYVLHFDGHLVVFNLENPSAPPLVSPRMREVARCAFLTETPDGEDLLLLWRNSTILEVFRLDKDNLGWIQLQSIGDVALFFCGTYLSSLSTREFSCLRSNCVYFTDDIGVYGGPDYTVNHVGVYDLEDGSIHPLNLGDDDREELHPPSLVWFIPPL